jgi:hypothetical protein
LLPLSGPIKVAATRRTPKSALGAGLRTPTERPTDRSQAPRTKPSPIANIRFRSADRRKETLRSGTRAGSRDPRPAHGPLWSARSLLPLSGPIKVAASRRTPKSALGAGLRTPTERPTDRSHAPRTKRSPIANIRFRSTDRRKETLRSGTRAGSRVATVTGFAGESRYGTRLVYKGTISQYRRPAPSARPGPSACDPRPARVTWAQRM